ncbi:MAG TPA: hypothetical protein VM345_13275 [Acidimicrobiales bacterium]|jgi:hypothetical protein|nr:hypothetical protein [Acidimicrobiales bacterium]
MEWIEDREPFDLRSTGRNLVLALAITIGLTLFAVAVVAGLFSWAAAVAGL